MAMDKPYSDLVAQAERAVAGVKDAELRRVAFQRVLDDLLSHDPRPAPPPAPRRDRPGPEPHRAVKPKRGGPQACVEELAGEGFFKKPKTISAVKVELENRGHHIPLTSLSGPLQKCCKKKLLRRQRVEAKGKKRTFAYSDW